MEGLGVAASAVDIIDLSFKVISLCFRYAKDVKKAKNDIDELHKEVKELQRVVENAKMLLDSQPGSRLKTSRDLDQTLQSSFGLLSKLEKTLQPSSSSKAMTRMGIRALKWPFQSSELDRIIQSVRQCSHRVGLALQLDQTAILLDVDSKTDKVVNTVESMDQRRVLDTLPIAMGAWYNSHAEEHNSICLENTRVELLQEIDSWVNSRLAQTIFWLSGMAGTGKSTISRTVATSSAKRNILGASFLFKRGEPDRGNISRFYTTVASQLVRFKPDLALHMKAAIDDDPSLTGKAAGEQFDKLILQPLLSSQTCEKDTLVLVVDALDECDGDGDIRRLIDLLARFSQVKSLKIRALITSRPELPIRLGFSAIHGSYQNVVLHEIPETIIEHDLTVFFKERLTEIRRSYDASVPEERKLPGSWPDLNDYKSLVQMSVPLFIFAATVCRFLSDRKCGTPNQQLQKVLAYKSRSQESKLEATYLPPLEQQLTGLSVREQDGVLKEFRHIVGTIVVLEKPLSASALAQLLDISRDTIDVRLDMLHSVLDVPRSSNSPIRLLHLSFRDFLLDPEKIRTNQFWVDEKQAHAQTAANCLRVMDKCLREDICNLIAPGTDSLAVPPRQIASCIPMELQYACCYWAYHLQNSERGFCSDEEVLDFLTRHFLHWLEVLSLIRRSAEGFQIVKLLRALMQNSQCGKLSKFLREAYRFIQTNFAVIDSSPLQLYSSLLVFTPKSSVIRSTFWDRSPQWISLVPEPEQNWDQCQQVIEGHDSWVTAVSFSPDSSLIASASLDKTVRICQADTGQCIRELEADMVEVRNVKFSPDSSLIAFACLNGDLQLCRGDTGHRIRKFQTCSQNYSGEFQFSSDSKLLAFISRRETLRILRLDTLDRVQDIEPDDFPFACTTDLPESKYPYIGRSVSLIFSPDSKILATLARWSGDYAIWTVDTGDCIRKSSRNAGFCRNFLMGAFSFAFIGDSSFMVAGALKEDDKIIQIRWVDSNKVIQSLKGHGKPVFGTEFSPDYTILGSFSQDRSVRTWKVATGECLHVLNGHSSLPATMSFSPDMSLIASGAHDRTVRIWRVNSDEDTRQPAADHDSIKSVIVSPGRTLVASSSERGKVRVWNIDTGECLHRDLEHGDEKIRSLAFYSNSKLIFARSLESETLWVWRVDTGQCVRKLSIVGSQQVSFSPNGQSITLIQKNNLLLLLAGETLHCNYRFKGSGPIFKQVFSPDSTLVAALSYPSKDCSGNPDLRIWSVDTGKLIWTIKGLEEGTETLAVSPDSKLVAVFMYCESGDGDGVYRFRVLQMETGKTICGGELDILGLRSVSFTHDSKYLALGSDDFVEIWDISSGERIRDINLGFYPSRFDFDTDREHLLTNFGSVSIDRSLPIATDWRSGCSNCRSGYGISGDRCWIMWDDTKFFWLPPALRPNTYCVEVSGSTIVLGSQTGRVLLFKFTIGELILKNRSLT